MKRSLLIKVGGLSSWVKLSSNPLSVIDASLTSWIDREPAKRISEDKMKLKLHHINLSTNNVAGMDHFYRDVLGLKTETEGLPALEKKKGYDGNVAFVSDGHIQTHLAQKDLHVGFRTGHIVNPLERGHIAYRTDDLAAFKAHLEEKGIAYSDWGETAVAGWQQIFFYDPDGNIIEVHEITR
ncbi:VOC family protein [Alphaproteobacteria bacterium]|nr:VOC family protein [Alphaproteobacteria bacterium]